MTPSRAIADRIAALEADNRRLMAEAQQLAAVIENVAARAAQSIESLRAERDRLAALEAENQRLREENDQLSLLACEMRRQRDDLESLRDALDCLDRIGQMVGFGEAALGPDDRLRLVREVREELERLQAERDRLAAALRAISDAAGTILTPVEVRVPGHLIVAARELIGAGDDADSAMETLIGPEEF